MKTDELTPKTARRKHREDVKKYVSPEEAHQAKHEAARVFLKNVKFPER